MLGTRWCGRFWTGAVLLAGCGERYGTTPEPALHQQTDADAAIVQSPESDAGPERDVDGGACDPQSPFGLPELVPGLSSSTERSVARLSPDELTVYFASYEGTHYDLYTASRPTATHPFGPPERLAVSSDHDEMDPWISGDGLTLFFARGKDGVADWKVLRSVRTTLEGRFETAAPVDGIDTPSDEWAGYLTPDHAVLYFASSRPGTGGYDLYRAIAKDAGFEVPSALVELNTAVNDENPVVTPDELTIYWASLRGDLGAKGNRDIFMATRPTKDAPFSDVRNVTELNTENSEYPSWVSSDGCTLYYWSPGKIFVARRPKR